MIKLVTGNIFDSECEALVNPINCIGVQGAGLAKEFAWHYPDNATMLRMIAMNVASNEVALSDKSKVLGTIGKINKQARIEIGKLLVNLNQRSNTGATKHIINFPTKTHWKYHSEYEYIELGLIELCRFLNKDDFIPTVALPMLGCGLGKLNPVIVMQMFEGYLQDHKTEFHIYNYAK